MEFKTIRVRRTPLVRSPPPVTMYGVCLHVGSRVIDSSSRVVKGR